MIIWKGWGILVLVFFIAATGVGGGIGQAIFPTNKILSSLTMSFSIIVGSLLLYKLSLSLNRPKKDKVLLDPVTNQQVVLKPNHSLFFIKMQYWAMLMGIVGVLSIFSAFFSSK